MWLPTAPGFPPKLPWGRHLSPADGCKNVDVNRGLRRRAPCGRHIDPTKGRTRRQTGFFQAAPSSLLSCHRSSIYILHCSAHVPSRILATERRDQRGGHFSSSSSSTASIA